MAPGIEISEVNWLAVGAAMLFNIALGFLWYSPMTPTGRVWIRETKMDASVKPTGAEMGRSTALMLVGSLFSVFVIAYVFLAFRDAFRLDGARTGAGGLEIVDGLTGGFFLWLGFWLPVQLGGVAWEKRSWAWLGVNAAYYLVSMLGTGAILAAMM